MILQVKNVSKWFGGLQALSNVTFDLPEGQILGLIGPNGAGKTTLFNVIDGVYPPNEGQNIFRGKDVTNAKTYQMAHMGLARTHQIVKPLNDLTVIENVIVGACFGQKNYGLRQAEKVAREVLEFVGLQARTEQLAGSLNVAQKKRLEMARALASEPHLMLLDEVLAGLNPTEIGEMVKMVRKIRDRGITIIMIEHVMHAIMNISERIIVLDFGKQVAEGTPEEIAANQLVIEAYLGGRRHAKKLSFTQEKR